MIKNVNWVLEDDTLLTYETEAGEGKVQFSDIVPYWKYATAEEFEGGKAKVFDDKLLIMLLVADRQGGIIVGWDAAEGKIEHVSGADYGLDMDMDGGSVYSLIHVESFGNAPKAFFEKAEYGKIDAPVEELQDVDMSIFDDFDGGIDDVKLSVDKDKIILSVGGKEHEV